MSETSDVIPSNAAEPAELILSAILAYHDRPIDATKINLFSHWPKNKIVSLCATVYNNICPFTGGSVYGIPVTENTNTCLTQWPVRLYQQ